jgi:F-type H+-transporting ATPase subunit gamma
MLAGTGADKVHLLIPVTGDRGLAGAFNSNIGRLTRNIARRLEAEGKTVKILPVGRKGRDYLRREMADRVVGEFSFANKKTVDFVDAQEVGVRVTEMLERGEFDVCTLIYNKFHSVISQIPSELQLVPVKLPEVQEEQAPGAPGGAKAVYEFEPDEETILARLLPQNLAIQVYRAMLENSAGFYGSQMTAMDNATRNAGDMIKRLSTNYNRARQANITRELIEIISGAEAL